MMILRLAMISLLLSFCCSPGHTSSSTYTDLHDFNNTLGAFPRGSLTLAPDGTLYGLTSAGGASTVGVIFSFDPSSMVYTDLHDFDGTHGSNPQGSLTLAPDGTLYGLASSGGAHSSDGVIFSFNPSSMVYTDLHDFDGTHGSNPLGSLTLAPNGIFYGLTNFGGAHSDGVIFSFDPSSLTYIDLLDFNGALSPQGANPGGSLILAPNGTFYGLTENGGAHGVGVIFSFDPSSMVYTDLYDFNGAQGANPLGSLTLAPDGTLYGLTSAGGANGFGVIFSFNPSSMVYTDLYDFNDTQGAYPLGSLTLAPDGTFYGLTSQGGAHSDGVIFSFDPSSMVYTDLYDFNGTQGSIPQGSLTFAPDGIFYGLTSQGGAHVDGVIFSFSPQPSPPGNLMAHQRKNDFGVGYSLFNQLRWTANQALGLSIASYIIYRDGVEIARVNGNTFLYNDGKDIKKGSTHVYGVVAVDVFGNSSAIATVTVK